MTHVGGSGGGLAGGLTDMRRSRDWDPAKSTKCNVLTRREGTWTIVSRTKACATCRPERLFQSATRAGRQFERRLVGSK